MLVGKSPWLASQWLFRSSGNFVSSTAATSTWFHARRDKHSSAGSACLADTHYAYLSRWPSGQFGLLRFRLHCRRPHPPHLSAAGHWDKTPACSLISVYACEAAISIYTWEAAIEAISAGRLLNCFIKIHGPLKLDQIWTTHISCIALYLWVWWWTGPLMSWTSRIEYHFLTAVKFSLTHADYVRIIVSRHGILMNNIGLNNSNPDVGWRNYQNVHSVQNGVWRGNNNPQSERKF